MRCGVFQRRFHWLVMALLGLAPGACGNRHPLASLTPQFDAGGSVPSRGATDGSISVDANANQPETGTYFADGPMQVDTNAGKTDAYLADGPMQIDTKAGKPDAYLADGPMRIDTGAGKAETGADLAVKAETGTPVADQSCVGIHNLGCNINEGFRYVGQTYTAGRSGTLSGVAIDVYATQTKFPLRVSLRNVVAGLPGQTILGTITLGGSGSTLTDILQFPSTITQVAGQQYAIVVDYPDAPPIGAGQWQGAWAGTSTGCYSGGNDVISVDGVNWESGSYDVHFKVFIEGN